MTTSRRRKILSKPTFQIKLTVIFMLVGTIVANLVGGLCYALITPKMTSSLEKISWKLADDVVAHDIFGQVAELLIPPILLAEAITLILVFCLCIWVTNNIAGPLYRLEKVARTIGDGDLSRRVQLRPKDELHELADAFNRMTRGLAVRLYRLQDAVDGLEKSGAPVGAVEGVRGALAEFLLPPREIVDAETEDEEAEALAASGDGFPVMPSSGPDTGSTPSGTRPGAPADAVGTTAGPLVPAPTSSGLTGPAREGRDPGPSPAAGGPGPGSAAGPAPGRTSSPGGAPAPVDTPAPVSGLRPGGGRTGGTGGTGRESGGPEGRAPDRGRPEAEGDRSGPPERYRRGPPSGRDRGRPTGRGGDERGPAAPRGEGPESRSEGRSRGPSSGPGRSRSRSGRSARRPPGDHPARHPAEDAGGGGEGPAPGPGGRPGPMPPRPAPSAGPEPEPGPVPRHGPTRSREEVTGSRPPPRSGSGRRPPPPDRSGGSRDGDGDPRPGPRGPGRGRRR